MIGIHPCCLFLLSTFFYFGISFDIVVETKCGKIGGGTQFEGKYHFFQGIPFAQKPERWQEPRSLEIDNSTGRCWEDVIYNATYSRDFCVQLPPDVDYILGSEDCLYLDVYLPTNYSGKLLPVFVWVYGGSLFQGQGSYNVYYGSPRTFSADNNVIVVSINYRLGPLGFLALPELSKNDKRNQNISGNYGLLDSIKAMEWVNEFIGYFGGDTSNITIFGQSSGGTLITAMNTSPLASGLYSSSITMSGSPSIVGTLEESYQSNYQLLTEKFCTDSKRGEELLECLLKLDAYELTMLFDTNPEYSSQWIWSIPKKRQESNSITQIPLLVIDGVSIPQSFHDAFSSGQFNYKSLKQMVFGMMREEIDFDPADIIINYTEPEYNELIKTNFDAFQSGLGDQVLKLYPFSDFSSPQQAYDQIGSDVSVICGNLELARLATKYLKNQVFVYLSPQAPKMPICNFLVEGYCVQYAFHMFDSAAAFSNALFYNLFFEQRDYDYGTLIRKLFVDLTSSSFVGRNHSWVPFGEDEWILNLNTENLRMEKNKRQEKCNFWKENGFDVYAWTN